MPPLIVLLGAVLVLLPAVAPADEAELPAWLIRLPESVPDVFVADAGNASIHHYERDADGIRLVGSSYLSIGKNGTGKARAGDRRTPIGTYFVTEQLDTSRLHEKYGATAFVLDYPNTWDDRHARSGDGIWVHGVDRRGGQRPTHDTDGCLALPNEQLLALADRFVAGVTPVIIASDVERVSDAERAALAAALEASVQRWSEAMQAGDLYTWLSLYGEDFERWGLTVDEWRALAAEALTASAPSAVTVRELLLLGYPDEPGLYLSRFQLRVENVAGETEVTKRLYWRAADNGELRIVAEDEG